MTASSLNLGPYLYRPVKLLDETKMSTLWVADEETRGHTPSAGGQVILKIARMSETRYSLTNQRAIENEERWLITLDHPNVVRLRTIAEKESARRTIYRARSDLPGNPWFLVIDFLPGGDLYSLLGERTKLPVSLALEIAERVGLALAYLHEQKCVHCDIKPRNILFRQKPFGYHLTAESEPIIIDFGIAKNPSDGPQLPSGTPRWITPELADALHDGRKIQVQPSWDVYALGLVLYHAVSGRKPDLDSPGHASWQPITASDLAGDPSVGQMMPLVKGLNELIAATTAARSQDRLSAQEFSKRVQALLRLTQTPWTVLPPPKRRIPWWMWAGATAALIFIALLAWMARPSDTEEDVVAPPPAVAVTPAPGEGSPTQGPIIVLLPTDTPTRWATSTRVHTPTPTHTPTPIPTLTPTPTHTPSPTSTRTNTPQPTATRPSPTPTHTPRPANTATPTPVRTRSSPTSTPVDTATPITPTPTPTPTTPPIGQPTAPPAPPPIPGDMRVSLTAPTDGFVGQGLVQFNWTPSRPLDKNECFEVRFWEGGQDNWIAGWGIWEANTDNYVTGRDFGESFEQQTGGKLRMNATYFWGVLLVDNCSAYRNNMHSNLRLVSSVRTFTYGAEGN